MRAFKNMSVRYKIMIPLITLAVIILLMGVTSYKGMNSIMDASTAISGNYARCLDMVGDFSADFQHMSRIAYNHNFLLFHPVSACHLPLENRCRKTSGYKHHLPPANPHH